jgi:hypothetical protein
MKKYLSKRDEALNLLTELIKKPEAIGQEIDYYKILDETRIKTGASKKIVAEIIDLFIRINKLTEYRIIKIGGEKK